MSQSVTFRRIKGRVVPVKGNTTHERIKGAAMIAGGLAATAGIAYAGAKFALKGKMLAAKSYSASTRGLQLVNESLQAKRLGQAADAYKKAKPLLAIGEHASKIAPIVGATLAGAGAYKVFKGKGPHAESNAALAASGTSAAAYAIARKLTMKIAFPFIKKV